METLDPNLSPLKRPKIDPKTLDSPITPSTDKGKAPIIPTSAADGGGDDETTPPLPPQSCGICFASEGRYVRGLIDSCTHYFCFLCIVEWSKIESRCPLCRGRFSTIRRMRKDGSFIGDGSVKVPVRDQIYDPFGQPNDPYGHARCSVCSGTNDESLLLLCDLCDSASHTFCVGLGATVPEGDWYCRDCTLLRAEQLDTEMDDNVQSPPETEQIVKIEDGHDDGKPPATTASVSIFDIVREPRRPVESNSGTDRLLKIVSSHPTRFSSSSIVSSHRSATLAESLPGARGNSTSPSNIRDSSARTLHNCRDVHKHIRVLRENWDALRAGFMTFPSNLLYSSDKVSRKLDMAAVSVEGSLPLKAGSTPAKSSQPKSKDTMCEASQTDQSYNVEKAWKLMNAAKSLPHPHKAKVCTKTTPNKNYGGKVDNTVLKCLLPGKKNLRSPRLGLHIPVKNINDRLAQSSGKHNFSGISPVSARLSVSKHQKSCVPRESAALVVRTTEPATTGNNKASYTSSCTKLGTGESSVIYDDIACSASSPEQLLGPSGVAGTSLLSQGVSKLLVKPAANINKRVTNKDEVQSSIPSSQDRTGLPSLPNQDQGLSKVSADRHGSTYQKSLGKTLVAGSDTSSLASKGKEVFEHPAKVGAKVTSKAVRDGEAKDEILSLVKLNLKLLGKDKQLGTDSYKEIARLSTHTILAACGFKHRDIARPVPALECHHANLVQQPCRSSVVPNSCRECFYTFVKDVVNSIFSEKINDNAVAC